MFDSLKPKLRSSVHKLGSQDSGTNEHTCTMMLEADAPTARDIYRHRKQFGVNLGAAFVGERWISDKLYTCADKSLHSELSAVQSHARKFGLVQTQKVWEDHWTNWFTESDATYLSNHGINSVRIPLGFFSLSYVALLEGTAFIDYPKVYENCWSFVERIIHICASKRIGVLLDLHCLPGGQNNDAHCGTDNKTALFYTSEKYRHTTLEAVKFLVDKAAQWDNVIGVQVMNEPLWGKESVLYSFYSACIDYAAIRGGIPLYIGDGWNLSLWSKWVGQRDEFIVVDHHYYHCFTEADHKMSPSDHIAAIRRSQELTDCAALARGNITIGEWSVAMDGKSKDRASADDLQFLRREFARAQIEKYSKNCGGCFFWTYKFQIRNNNNDWDIRDMIDFGVLTSPLCAQPELDPEMLKEKLAVASAEKLRQHCDYWQSRGTKFEHWRFEEGFSSGWQDTVAFIEAGSQIGYVGEWKKKRRTTHVQVRGQSEFVWEFDTGYAAGLDAANAALGL